ncbi:MAG TPA: aminotransferase class V-fold PLP-dependent enzyme, partial [Ruminiclostridium sp.]|nr:aminotransferase class V-fold PLP-dependent enzyme [Ruminiclostridium sp.]
EAEELFADAFGAQRAFFLVNGTTSGVQSMIISTCRPGSKIILPRNAHKSAIGGIILSGAIPVYIQPEINRELGIAMGITNESFKQAIKENANASAAFIINPTYYGAASDIRMLVRSAHIKGITVLVDEAHGAHMSFSDKYPLTAMEAGADMSSISLHKTGGSMTQTSVLLLKNRRDTEKVRQVLNLTYTSSASYVLLCSIDVARKQLALNGKTLLDRTFEYANWARTEINKIKGMYAFGSELAGTPGCFDFDETKLGINVRRLGVSGYKVESILRKDYNIQVEMSDLYNILAVVTIGDKKENLEALVNALKDISDKSNIKEPRNDLCVPMNPEMIVAPREAFYSAKKTVRIEESVGEIAGEMVMAYPPGIPVVVMGERITEDIVDYIKLLKEERCELQGTCDLNVNEIKILGKGKSNK